MLISQSNLFMPNHQDFMRYCLKLAAVAKGYTKTNPLVACIIVHENKIIGEGYHRSFGAEHAEVNAFAMVENKSLLKESTVYVNLEPCSYYGKTPACCDLFEKYPCKEIIIGMKDPNPLVAGNGIARLKAAGIKVLMSDLEAECKQLNVAFCKSIVSAKPYVIAKFAQSQDGFITKIGERTQISNALVNLQNQQWRIFADAIIIGNNTLKIDNPLLSQRVFDKPQPLRVVLGKTFNFELPFFQIETPICCFGSNQISPKAHINVFETTDLKEILTVLYKQNIGSVVIEGGLQVLQSFIDQDLVDELYVVTNTTLALLAGVRAPSFEDFCCMSEDMYGNNRIEYFVK